MRPTLRWLADHGAEYRGVLYAGMMLTADGPKVIEYNVRFGDPECQVVLPRVTSDVAELLLAAATGDKLAVTFSDDAAVTVVLAADGYPTSPRTGDPITGVDVASGREHRHRLPRRHRTRRPRSAPHRRRPRPRPSPPPASTSKSPACAPTKPPRIINFKGMRYRHDIAAQAAAATAPQRVTSPW